MPAKPCGPISLNLTLLICLTTLSAFGQSNAAPETAPRRPANSPTSAIQLAEEIRAVCIQGRRSICGRVLRVLPDGLVVESGYTNLLREPLNQSWLVPGTVTASRATNLVESSEPGALCAGQVFLTDLPKSRGAKPQQYDYVVLTGYPTGSHTYTSVGEVKKTVRRFSASLDRATKLNFETAQNESPARPTGVK